jgi:uncharacterized protein with GYD domain
MSTYIVQGRWSPDGVKGMLAHPEDRADALKKLYDAIGGKLISYYVTFSEYDFLVVAEASCIPSFSGDAEGRREGSILT